MHMCLARPGWAENVPPRTTHPSGERCRDAYLQATEGQDTVGQADAWPEAPGHSATTRPEPPGVDTVGVAGALQARKREFQHRGDMVLQRLHTYLHPTVLLSRMRRNGRSRRSYIPLWKPPLVLRKEADITE